MCVCDLDHAPAVWTERKVKSARKKHMCSECSSDIDIGESYTYVFAVYDDPFNLKFCDICKSKMDEYSHLCWCVGSLWETIIEFE